MSLKLDQVCIPKQTKSSLAVCFCVHVRVCVHLPSAALSNPKPDKQFRKWMAGWMAHSSARQMESNASRKQPDQPWLSNQ